MAELEKSPHYVLVIDKNRDTIITCLLEAALHNPIGAVVFKSMMQAEKISDEEVNAFIQDLAEKTHEMGWCTSPDCKYVKKEKI